MYLECCYSFVCSFNFRNKEKSGESVRLRESRLRKKNGANGRKRNGKQRGKKSAEIGNGKEIGKQGSEKIGTGMLEIGIGTKRVGIGTEIKTRTETGGGRNSERKTGGIKMSLLR